MGVNLILRGDTPTAPAPATATANNYINTVTRIYDLLSRVVRTRSGNVTRGWVRAEPEPEAERGELAKLNLHNFEKTTAASKWLSAFVHIDRMNRSRRRGEGGLMEIMFLILIMQI